jgi:hypothetical protein
MEHHCASIVLHEHCSLDLCTIINLQEYVIKRKEISKQLRLKQTRAGQRRTTWLPVLFLFISTWGIMTGSGMVHKSFYQGQIPEHPFSLVNPQLAGTYTRMEALDRLVVLSPGVLLQYQKVQEQQLWLKIRSKQVRSNECEKQEEINCHFDEFFIRSTNRHFKSTNTRSSSTVRRISQFMKRSKILLI